MLFDGAIGTLLHRKGISLGVCLDEICLSQPELILDVHKSYIEAGSNIITTNTFGATIPRLSKYGLESKANDINKAAVDLAKLSIIKSGKVDDVYIAGSIGPIRHCLPNHHSKKDLETYFTQQAQSLYNAGVDLFVLETFFDMEELHYAITSVKTVCNIPIISEITINHEGKSLDGFDAKSFTKDMDTWGSDIIGLNCSYGADSMLGIIPDMINSTDKPICMQPSAGIPIKTDVTLKYPCKAYQMTQYAKLFVSMGVKLVGGCCGTDPGYIKSIRESI